MGVKACVRFGCEEELCEYLIPDVGYLCCDCKDEFIEYASQEYVHNTQRHIIMMLKEFIKRDKLDEVNPIEKSYLYDFFERHIEER